MSRTFLLGRHLLERLGGMNLLIIGVKISKDTENFKQNQLEENFLTLQYIEGRWGARVGTVWKALASG